MTENIAAPSAPSSTETTPLLQSSSVSNGIAKVDEGFPRTASGQGTPSVLAALWSKLTFRWFGPILERGNQKKKLDPEDLDLIPFPIDCSTSQVTASFDRCWERELKTHPTSPSLVRALCWSFGPEFVRAGCLKLVHDLMVFVGPNVLHAMIVFLRDPSAPTCHGITLAMIVTASQMTMSLCLRHYFFKCYITGLRIRTSIVSAVYRKALRLSAEERQTRTVGEITNLSSIDAQRLQGNVPVPCPHRLLSYLISLSFAHCSRPLSPPPFLAFPFHRSDNVPSRAMVQSRPNLLGSLLFVPAARPELVGRGGGHAVHDPRHEDRGAVDGGDAEAAHEGTG
jgi:hypothetical protein